MKKTHPDINSKKTHVKKTHVKTHVKMLKRFSFSAMSCHVMPTTLTPSPCNYLPVKCYVGKNAVKMGF